MSAVLDHRHADTQTISQRKALRQFVEFRYPKASRAPEQHPEPPWRYVLSLLALAIAILAWRVYGWAT